ncbi:hypothetical protein ACIRRA_04915 [Nocardia sp. NPDC101769]|uniref:hypothetical protein n=1 Tax=Nocardia sp. NPDC101769 TaxID=3364333 RepID=UPI003813DD68
MSSGTFRSAAAILGDDGPPLWRLQMPHGAEAGGDLVIGSREMHQVEPAVRGPLPTGQECPRERSCEPGNSELPHQQPAQIDLVETDPELPPDAAARAVASPVGALSSATIKVSVRPASRSMPNLLEQLALRLGDTGIRQRGHPSPSRFDVVSIPG